MARKRVRKEPFSLAAALGAAPAVLHQRFTIYLPSKDKNDREIKEHARWVKEARQLLTQINRGATALPPADGTWEADSGEVIWEKTRMVYSFIRPRKFKQSLSRLREYLHRFGRETNQGEVVVEFDGQLFSITEFDHE